MVPQRVRTQDGNGSFRAKNPDIHFRVTGSGFIPGRVSCASKVPRIPSRSCTLIWKRAASKAKKLCLKISANVSVRSLNRQMDICMFWSTGLRLQSTGSKLQRTSFGLFFSS